jgi:hypothetical protein
MNRELWREPNLVQGVGRLWRTRLAKAVRHKPLEWFSGCRLEQKKKGYENDTSIGPGLS